MARSNLTSGKRSFGKNGKSFLPDTSAQPIAITVAGDGIDTTDTTVVVNPKTLEYSGPNGEALSDRVSISRPDSGGRFNVRQPDDQ